ncbi:hypothetical protein [Acinetobacter radioresistens]|uniref:hypothetical protein n=1 Tax=Acinetobacter radioresistens TaxID=40216 RepID=UPI003B284947
MDIKEKQARWALEKPLFEAEFIHSHLLPFFTFNENTGDYEIKSECVNNADDEDRKVAYETLNTGWVMWLRAKRDAKAQAVPEGYQLVKKPRPLVGNNNVDFSQAPEWAKFWLKDGYSKRCVWSNKRPKIDVDIGCFVFPYNYQVIEAPDFGFDGDWSKSLTSRKAMIEPQEST